MDFPIELPPDYVEKAKTLGIDGAQITERFIRGSGAGGQKINKTSNCVQLKYEPLKLEIKCQKHREREKNRLSAYKLLIKKIDTIVRGEESDEAKRIFKLKKQKQRRSRRAKEKMLEQKKKRSVIKTMRKPVTDVDE